MHTEKTMATLSRLLSEAYEQAAIYRALWLDRVEEARESQPEIPEYGENAHISSPVRLPSRQSEAGCREYRHKENSFD